MKTSRRMSRAFSPPRMDAREVGFHAGGLARVPLSRFWRASRIARWKGFQDRIRNCGQTRFPAGSRKHRSVDSAHARWAPHETSFEISSTDDESPQFHVGGDDGYLTVLFTSEASPALMSHVFHVHLRCFWSLFGCRHARQIAALLWQDKNSIEAATLARLNSNDPCPDRILAGAGQIPSGHGCRPS